MPRGGPRPGAGRPKKIKAEQQRDDAGPKEAKKYQRRAPPPTTNADGFKAEDTSPNWPFGQERPPPQEPEPDLSGLMPLDYLLSVMRNKKLPEPMRMQAATLAAQYCHAKPAPKSAKQEAEAERQKNRSSRFGRRQPPTLTAVQGGKS
ncbi:hypothetical protein [Comamonas terrigena]|uniref:hypothetical protein n=1 Tax=Comamonas terrigena TaxID=32013 RepID=UPI0028972FFF|nr:hypothetical protein [Comamonas terrigena]